MSHEIWAVIPGFGGHYEASDMGRIRVKQRTIFKPHSQSGELMRYTYGAKMLSPAKDSKGYYSVHIGVDKKKTKLSVHRAVLLAFTGPAPDGCEACHNNGKSDDNRLMNLRWDTHFNNNQDRVKHGTYLRGEGHPMAKINAELALTIYQSNERGVLLARRLGVCQTKISAIRLGKIWASVTGGTPRPKLHKPGNNRDGYGTQHELLAEAKAKLGLA